ncbi:MULTISPECIES: glutathione S-transferase family protein [Bradyrhizobium]|uniref:glutathione transferase n=1 Tax=Bradyrhizobium ottawaense TaxID=931866 RepID=A0A2U8PBQ6_9BRAD|nr:MULTISPECIES: glutathione S-transferase family protein [Bradyrhizobium]AWL95182.1 glutathione S-transferase family protein [Bradyrhizobium ottawaense]MBR1324799.1 glutathione S-transferase family protein [Bradyrhizobium ottawaense]MBR1336617.1 glutathione S-transferase family protein [Bradyrhizobium ottawaense]MBR1365697.1 glutathione S-transferase family protein [Bradyrhizobium ottawaense]MDA9448123.1 glutathione S-transferase [Bradyrhizobium sp. CCBAU 21360]
MLTVHHLGKSQSERIVWLCEELGLHYELKRYARDPVTMLAPPEYKALHPSGAAPVVTDGDLVLAESGAIVDYIVAKYGNGRLVLGPNDPAFPQFLYWLHFANGTLQPGMGRMMILNRLDLAQDNPTLLAMKGRLDRSYDLLDAHLRDAEYLAGNAFTTADIMMGFSLTTMRYFQPYDVQRCPNVVKYLGRVSARPAYRRAMEKGDPGMALLLG